MLKRPAVLAVLAVFATVVAFAIAVVPSAQAATPIRIMPLGDSITGSPGCWRALLWQHLQQTGFTNIDMVGTLGPQGCSVPYDGDNEGHGGALVTAVADQNQLVGWLAATHPDIVMMHFGTNDVWSNLSTDQILAAYSKLVDQMRASNAAMKILVAEIIPVAPPSCPECPARTVALNNAIPAWAASKTTAQSPITVVDQWTGWNASTDTADGVHPNDTGIVKMADKWYSPLTAAIGGTTPPSDGQAPTTPTNLGVRVSCTPLAVTLNWTASTDDVGVTGYDIFRATNGGAFTSVATTTTTTFTEPLTGISQYEVRARDAAGNTSAFTAPISALPPPCPTNPPPDTQAPTTPGTPTATVTCGSATLNWTASTDNVSVSGYDIFSAPGTSGGTFVSVGTSTINSVTESGVGIARYEIRARDAAGNTSAFTPPITVNTPACPTDVQPPTTPGTPTASGVTASQATLSWSASTDNAAVTGYDIFRAPGASGGTFASVGTSTTASFTDSGLTASTTYRYQVRARDAAGNLSPFSAAVTVTTTGGGTGGCTGVYSPVGNPWPGGFQGQVTVTNTATTATTAWTVTLTFANGQSITQIWGAKTTSTASPYTITNETYNGALGPNASTTFGFLASWNGTNNAPTVSCTRTP